MASLGLSLAGICARGSWRPRAPRESGLALPPHHFLPRGLIPHPQRLVPGAGEPPAPRPPLTAVTSSVSAFEARRSPARGGQVPHRRRPVRPSRRAARPSRPPLTAVAWRPVWPLRTCRALLPWRGPTPAASRRPSRRPPAPRPPPPHPNSACGLQDVQTLAQRRRSHTAASGGSSSRRPPAPRPPPPPSPQSVWPSRTCRLCPWSRSHTRSVSSCEPETTRALGYRHRRHTGAVAFQDVQTLSRGQVPHPHRLVLGAGDHPPLGHRHRSHPAACGLRRTCSTLPEARSHTRSVVIARAGDHPPLGHRHRRHLVRCGLRGRAGTLPEARSHTRSCLRRREPETTRPSATATALTQLVWPSRTCSALCRRPGPTPAASGPSSRRPPAPRPPLPPITSCRCGL